MQTKKYLLTVLSLFLLTMNISFAANTKILKYNENEKKLKVEIDGKEYNLDIPIDKEKIQTSEKKAITEDKPSDKENSNEDVTLKAKIKKEYAKGPATTTIGARLFNIPSDNVLPKHGLGLDFTHRFSTPIKEETANEVYGLDSFAYTGIGLYYGITNHLEAHAFRLSLTDASEFGLKYQVFKEAKKFGDGAPFGFTLSSGFQNDNIQNSIDPYVQGIFTKVLAPRWLKVYVAPTWADKSSTIGMSNSLSASFFTFTDPKKRDPGRQGTFALPIGGALQIVPGKVSLLGEYTPVLAGYKEVDNGWAFGLQILSRLETHVWTVGVSNVPYSSFGQFVVGGPSNDWHLGFNVTARIK